MRITVTGGSDVGEAGVAVRGEGREQGPGSDAMTNATTMKRCRRKCCSRWL